jgi:hypothetical protein
VNPGRDLRLLVVLVVLCLTAALLLLTAAPEGDRKRTLARGTSATLDGAATQAEPLPDEARRVARRWAGAYFSGSWRDSAARRSARLEPYSSHHLIAEMSSNSGALNLVRENSKHRWRSRAKVVALQQQDGSADRAVIAIVERTTTGDHRSSTELVTVTLELAHERGAWLVTSVLVP